MSLSTFTRDLYLSFLKKIVVFFRDYTKFADLAFLYYFVVKIKINSAKSFPPMGIEPETLGL